MRTLTGGNGGNVKEPHGVCLRVNFRKVKQLEKIMISEEATKAKIETRNTQNIGLELMRILQATGFQFQVGKSS